MNNAIRLIGIIFSVEVGLTKSVSAVGRILIGLIAGLPPTAIAVSAMVSCTAAAALEFPTGLLTDLLGRVRMTRFGYVCQALASLLLFASLVSYPTHPNLMWTFLILEALFDALGSALASGSLEAFFQEIIVRESRTMPADDAAKFREAGLLQAEAYGRYFAFLAPILGLGAALILKSYFDLAHLVLLVHAAGWVVVTEMIGRLARAYDVRDERTNRVAERVTAWADGCRDLFRGRGEAGVSGLVGTLGLFMLGSVEAFYLVTVLRDVAGHEVYSAWVPALIVTVTAALGQLGRSFLLPYLSSRFANISLVVFGLVGQAVLSVLMICGAEFTSGWVWTTILIVYPTMFGLLIGFVIRPTIGMLFVDTRPEVHATVMSLRSAVAMLMMGIYSAALTFGVGTPTIPWMMMLNISICVVAMLILSRRMKAV